MGSKCLPRRILRSFRRSGSKPRQFVLKKRQFGAIPNENHHPWTRKSRLERHTTASPQPASRPHGRENVITI